jgi:GGDEF domain-containing protein
MGELLNNKCRKDNVVGRIGGEAFSILLVNCPMTDTENFINRLLADFALITVETENGQKVGTTLSIGATSM